MNGVHTEHQRDQSEYQSSSLWFLWCSVCAYFSHWFHAEPQRNQSEYQSSPLWFLWCSVCTHSSSLG
jgi:hypothetical protein